MMGAYSGEVYQAVSGQWSWRITDDDGEVCGGAGYDEEEDAAEAMADVLASYQEGGRDAF